MSNKQLETIVIEQELSVEELKESSSHLAELVRRHEEVKAEKAAANKASDKLLKSIESMMTIRAAEVENSVRMVSVITERRKNYDTNNWEYVDPETGVVMKLLPMKPEDLQVDLLEAIEE